MLVRNGEKLFASYHRRAMASLRLAKFSSPQQSTKAPSPLVGEGCEALASVSELRRSWMRGSAPIGARARKSAMTAGSHQSQRSRAARLSARPPHPASAKLTLFAKPSQPSPARGEGYWRRGSRRLELLIRPLQIPQRVLLRHLELDQQLACHHVAALLVLGQLHVRRDGDPAVDVAVEDRGAAFLVAHVDILQPVEVVPAHHLDIFLEERRDARIVRHQVHVVAIADVLADFLLALGIEAGGVLDELVDILSLGVGHGSSLL